jgi:hypothetical protein
MMIFDEWFDTVKEHIPLLLREKAKEGMLAAWRAGFLEGYQQGKTAGHDAATRDPDEEIISIAR